MTSFSCVISSNLFLEKDLADVHFLVTSDNGQQERIPAHKMVLGIASDVFKAKFYGPSKEGNNEIRIDNASSAAVKELLRSIYTNQLTLTAKTIADVMRLAQEYGVARCFDICKRYLDQNLSFVEPFSGLKLAVLCEQSELKKKFAQIIAEQPKKVLESTEFFDCSYAVLKS